mmetsp:Transcript_7960/g.11514  ORF Transcript_7960/g.11514 Transcript_7960/m.11514 type:complete len:85 (-) Transcript_7960:322-576(-)
MGSTSFIKVHITTSYVETTNIHSNDWKASAIPSPFMDNPPSNNNQDSLANIHMTTVTWNIAPTNPSVLIVGRGDSFSRFTVGKV